MTLPDGPYWQSPAMVITWRQFSRSGQPVEAVPDPDPLLTRLEAGYFYQFASRLIEAGKLTRRDLLPLNLLFIEIRRMNQILDEQRAGQLPDPMQGELNQRMANLLKLAGGFSISRQEVKELLSQPEPQNEQL
jgi:hypothetical protein